ncbi:MAG TPA: type II toxin-antitoxin system VapC family toxin [Chloroflexota bacterium]|jgi:predicted nucleic acid-binding protein
MICIDASVAAKWILDEEHSETARSLHDTCVRTGELIVAPPFLPIEVTNILRQRMRREGLLLAEAIRLIEQFLQFPVNLTTVPGLYQQALALADAYALPAAYDAHYAALAQSLRCNLWTDDQRLLGLLAGRLAFVRWIGDYQEGDPV